MTFQVGLGLAYLQYGYGGKDKLNQEIEHLQTTESFSSIDTQF